MKRLIPIILGVLLLTSCTSKTVIDEERTLEKQWNRFTPEVFNLQVNNVENYYNIDLAVAVDTTVYRYDQLPVMLVLDGANGEQRQFYGTVLLKDKGRWRGEMDGDYRLVSGRIRSYFSFNAKGAYRLAISQTTSQYDLEGIHSLALSITKAKIDYNL